MEDPPETEAQRRRRQQETADELALHALQQGDADAERITDALQHLRFGEMTAFFESLKRADSRGVFSTAATMGGSAAIDQHTDGFVQAGLWEPVGGKVHRIPPLVAIQGRKHQKAVEEAHPLQPVIPSSVWPAVAEVMAENARQRQAEREEQVRREERIRHEVREELAPRITLYRLIIGTVVLNLSFAVLFFLPALFGMAPEGLIAFWNNSLPAQIYGGLIVLTHGGAVVWMFVKYVYQSPRTKKHD